MDMLAKYSKLCHFLYVVLGRESLKSALELAPSAPSEDAAGLHVDDDCKHVAASELQLDIFQTPDQTRYIPKPKKKSVQLL